MLGLFHVVSSSLEWERDGKRGSQGGLRQAEAPNDADDEAAKAVAERASPVRRTTILAGRDVPVKPTHREYSAR
jgi:hypothetical protein